MAVSIDDLCADLAAETAVLAGAIDVLPEAEWNTMTPADGWSIKDEVSHLEYFDRAVTTAVTDPERFVVDRRAALAERTGGSSFVDAIAEANRARSGAEVNERFRSARAAMVEAFRAADPSVRVPWYGPDMSVASALTARIMETWAHGQDVFDALGVRHPVTPALRQVAHIGVRALPNSFIARGRDVPGDAIYVALDAGDGEVWTWGPHDATQRVTGRAEEFCLVVTQRRHVADTALVASGDVAVEWLSIAQAFAGPAGPGRAPGQFPPLP